MEADITQQLRRIPEPLRGPVAQVWESFAGEAGAIRGQAGRDDWLQSLPAVWAASEFVMRTCERQPAVLAELVQSGDLYNRYEPGRLARRIVSGLGVPDSEARLKSALRRLRRREMLRVAWRDLAGWADLAEVMATLSELADTLVDAALGWLYAQAVKKYGRPTGAHSGEAVGLTVLGLGKLGGRELNFSSDIDLIFFYAEEGETGGERPLSNHEFFIRLARGLINALNETTEEGFVFRVDMRLRPNGNSGPMALCFDAAELYYQTHGREWERYALIKARVVAGDREQGEALLARLHPFVYRKYLDYGAIEAVRGLKRSIHQELRRKGIEDNIKLGPGGIREIEFIGQAFQLIRGGREPALQAREILTVLARLGERAYLTAQAVEELTAAYVFLRDTEHRLQMAHDTQTHVLPASPVERLRLAFAMGYEDWETFLADLRFHMRKVHEHFSQVFVSPQGEAAEETEPGLAAVWEQRLDESLAVQVLAEAGYGDEAASVLELLRGFRAGHSYNALDTEGRRRVDVLMPLLLGAAALSPSPRTTLSRLIKLLESIGRRSAYLALLIENPMALSQVVKLSGASPWIADWIAQHPLLLDELVAPVDTQVFASREQLSAELARHLEEVAEDDLERQMEVLREFCNVHVLRVAAADIGPGLAPEQVGTQLSLIAEVLIQASLDLARRAVQRRHGRPRCTGGGPERPGFAVIAYGKLGGRELGHGSDVDVIFLYEPCTGGGQTDGPRPLANETFFARVGQRLIHLLTTRTTGGILYEVDMRLRPSGQSGPLVTSLDAFREYQLRHAWTWEHQALVRARPVAGDAAVARAFARIRREILCRPRDEAGLKRDVVAMREKMRAARPPHPAGLFNLKHDRGGIVDIEFMVQYWVLRRAHEHPALIEYTDNVHILKALGAAGLLDPQRVRLLVDAYTRYLSTEHHLKLMVAGPLVRRETLGDLPQQVAAVWDETFSEVHAASAKA